jgi:hypothetical protein
MSDRVPKKSGARTLENDGLVWDPYISKNPSTLFRFKTHPTRPIGENMNPARIQEMLDWIASEVFPVFLPVSWEVLIELRVLLESETLFALATAEIPKNF